ncbi:hypothetical protein NECAME_04149 [Necator americanus]|uniref:Uncharacterized protein n=1 Tax=Necator americanus TaxID=51031 RepID=W2SWV6_NECAM|nr:hypothetical protein NECAME_04149 [Necator americanus]ETN74120.1 hypothetical protein NECAME_04149 [Necator americanus]
MEEETCGWFILNEGILKVWEGVCALLVDNDVHFFKVRDGRIFGITLENAAVTEMISDGYWSCVEVTGKLEKGNGSFYYHADSPRNAYTMLQHTLDFSKECISSLLVRLDPDPLRCRDIDWISERITTWSQFGRYFCSEAQVVLDSNMPL